MILSLLNNRILQEKKTLKLIAKFIYLPRGLRFHDLSEYFLIFLIANKKFWNHSMVKMIITFITLKTQVVILVEWTT